MLIPSDDDIEAKKVGDTGIANRTAQSVVSNCLTVLTGGPGTGKTFTLTRCLAVLLSANESKLENLSIAVVAPTGKAATRAKELLSDFVADARNPEKANIGVSESVLQVLSKMTQLQDPRDHSTDVFSNCFESGVSQVILKSAI